MSTTRVLHVIARMNVGGTARYLAELVDHIPDSKIAAGFVQRSEIEDPLTDKIPIIRIKHLGRRISPINDYKAWKELRQLIHEYEPSIVHTHTFKAGLIGRLISGRHKRVHTFHGHLFDDSSLSSVEKLVVTWTERFLGKRTNVFISVGEKVGRELRGERIGTEKKWYSIAPGVDKLPIIDRRVAREKLALSESDLLIGWIARMAPVKNPHLFLEVATHFPGAQFVMAGGGDLLEYVKSHAPRNVKVIGWTDPSVFLSAVDIIMSTSDNEGMPVALIEAQLAGVPIITTNVGSSAEVVLDGKTGFVVNNNIESLKMSLALMIDNPKLVKQMGKNSQLRASKIFKVQNMIDQHKSVYSELISDSKY
jgi:glycosyltransferase involved in cell wall biosynthesis